MILEPYREVFQSAAEQIAKAPWFSDSWVCKTGLWRDESAPTAIVLKLLKPHWSSDSRTAIVSESGVFFSVWVDESSHAKRNLRYNLHALKLRGLKGYALESREFAAAFRAEFSRVQRDWPNVRLDFGPQTLFEGFIEASDIVCESRIVELAAMFQPLGEVIDGLLARARI